MSPLAKVGWKDEADLEGDALKSPMPLRMCVIKLGISPSCSLFLPRARLWRWLPELRCG